MSRTVADNSLMDSTLKLPVGLYVGAVLFFPTPGVLLLLLKGHYSAAFLIAIGMVYAVGLGRTLLWRRLGRPAVPARSASGEAAPNSRSP